MNCCSMTSLCSLASNFSRHRNCGFRFLLTGKDIVDLLTIKAECAVSVVHVHTMQKAV